MSLVIANEGSSLLLLNMVHLEGFFLYAAIFSANVTPDPTKSFSDIFPESNLVYSNFDLSIDGSGDSSKSYRAKLDSTKWLTPIPGPTSGFIMSYSTLPLTWINNTPNPITAYGYVVYITDNISPPVVAWSERFSEPQILDKSTDNNTVTVRIRIGLQACPS